MNLPAQFLTLLNVNKRNSISKKWNRLKIRIQIKTLLKIP